MLCRHPESSGQTQLAGGPDGKRRGALLEQRGNSLDAVEIGLVGDEVGLGRGHCSTDVGICAASGGGQALADAAATMTGF